MNIVSLDVHAEASQLVAVTDEGEIIFEAKVPTDPQVLRTIIGGIAGPRRVVFEEGPLSAMLTDALQGVADEIISCDPTRNPTIARDENSNDERDARNLATLLRVGRVHPVFVAPEPYRTLRSLLSHDVRLSRSTASTKTRIKALCRRLGIPATGSTLYGSAGRERVLAAIERPGIAWQMRSLYRQLDRFLKERQAGTRQWRWLAGSLPTVTRLCAAPGVGELTAVTVVAWVVDPGRFTSRNAVSSYAGLGLGQGRTAWKPVGRAKASKRGQRHLKRILFLAANAARRGDNAFARRYQARRDAGWEHRKAIRDVARTLVWALCAMWKTQEDYDDARITVPSPARA